MPSGSSHSRSRFPVARLLHWFDRHQRPLPWRANRDPYRIWVSEVMLQQTQVATVIPFFERFLNTFPTLESLALADEQEVLKLWQGMGYYRRARHLHQAARRLIQDFPEAIPSDREIWASLPGVGRYIQGAVLSQAFDLRLPILEANTKRVLARVFAHAGDLGAKPTQDWLWNKAEEILPKKRVGDFNQALMELGALICTPRNPKCEKCPIVKQCRAFEEGLQETLPITSKKMLPTTVEEVAVVLRDGAKYLLCQRPEKGRWSRMWEFPHLALEPDETNVEAVKRLLQDFLNLRARLGKELTVVEHTVTRFKIRMQCFEAKWLGGVFASPFYLDGRWIELSEVENYPLSVPQRKIVAALNGT